MHTLYRKYKAIRVVVQLCLPLGVIIGAIFVGAAYLTAEDTPKEIPDMIAGHEVVLVKTQENTVCYRLDYPTLVLRAKEESIDGFLAGQSSLTVEQHLRQLGYDKSDYSLSFIGPGITKEELLRTHFKNNEFMKQEGCCVRTRPLTDEKVARMSQKSLARMERLGCTLDDLTKFRP